MLVEVAVSRSCSLNELDFSMNLNDSDHDAPDLAQVCSEFNPVSHLSGSRTAPGSSRLADFPSF